MAFTYRTETMPTVQKIAELEQIVIVDQTGPAVPVGAGQRRALLVGEFLSGPFVPTKVTSQGQIQDTFGTLSAILSQASVGGAQDGSGGFFDGNGFLELLGKTFNGLVIQRVDTEARTSAPDGATKGAVSVTVTVNAADITAGKTNKDIVLKGGTRFGDNISASAATVVVALSQNLTIPAGTTSAGTVVVTSPVFFVKAITVAMAGITSVIDASIPNVNAGTTITGIANATELDAPGTGADLNAKIASAYLGTANNPSAIGKTISTESPCVDVTDIWAARNTAAIRLALATNADQASKMGRGRRSCLSGPAIGMESHTTAAATLTAVEGILTAESYPTRDRVSLNFPFVQIFSTDLGSRNVLVSPAGFKASLFNTLPEEFESGVSDDEGIIQFIQGLEPGYAAAPLQRQDYVDLKAAGVSALIHDATVGWQFQSSCMNVDPVAFPTRVKDNRRRYADLWQDTLMGIAGPYLKKPGTVDRVDSLVGGIDAFGIIQTSPTNTAAQRCDSYSVDAKSANTAALTGAGIRTILVNVRMLGDFDDIVFVTRIGPTVDTAVTQSP